MTKASTDSSNLRCRQRLNEIDGMWEANILTLIIVIIFQSIAEVVSTLVVGVVAALAGFFESFVALGEGSLDWDAAELSAVDVL